MHGWPFDARLEAHLCGSGRHFTIFPGDGVEIMECLPLPQM